MKITKTVLGYDADGVRLPNEILCENAPEIIIEHEGIKIILRSLKGFQFITLVTPENDDDGVRRTYMEHFGATRIQQVLLKPQEIE